MRDTGDPSCDDGADTALLAQRIERLARDALAGFVPVARRLQAPLQSVLVTETVLLLRTLQDMHHAVRDAQHRDPLPRWLRWLGTTRSSGRRFQSDCHDAIACRTRLSAHAQRLAEQHQPSGAHTDLAPLLDESLASLDRAGTCITEAQALLATLWAGLRPQRPDPADPGSLDRLRALLAEVDGQRALLQRLDSGCGAGHDVARLGRAVLAGRSELLELADARFTRAWDDWCARIEPLLREGLQPHQLRTGARDATAARRGLLLVLDQMRAVCTRLQIDEQALAHALAQLAEQLESLPAPTPDEAAPGA
jgi:hypothetical protein